MDTVMSEKTIDNAASYDRVCEQWHSFRRSGGINPCVERFAAYLTAPCRILDVGCGTGYPIAAFFAARGFSVVGIDISAGMLEKARALQLPNAVFYQSDLLDFSPEEQYGAVIAFDSVWHIGYGDQKAVYARFSALLRPGGYLLFTHGKRDGETVGQMYGQAFYYSALSGDGVRRQLAENGFEVVEWAEDLREEITGDRELLVVARKL